MDALQKAVLLQELELDPQAVVIWLPDGANRSSRRCSMLGSEIPPGRRRRLPLAEKAGRRSAQTGSSPNLLSKVRQVQAAKEARDIVERLSGATESTVAKIEVGRYFAHRYRVFVTL